MINWFPGESIKALLQETARSHGLLPVWDFFRASYWALLEILRDNYLSPRMLGLVVLTLLLWQYWSTEKSRRLSLAPIVLDFLYPILAFPVRITAILAGATILNGLFSRVIPLFNGGLVHGRSIVLQTVMAILITDLMLYISHLMKHKVRWFWYFHTIHHSQRQLSPFTNDRNHPFEIIMNVAIRTLPIALVGGSHATWLYLIFFDDVWGYLIHTNLRTNLGPLKYIITTPQNHRVHHSTDPIHYDKNLGDHLIIWDWMFGTLNKDFDVYPDTGTEGVEWIQERSARPMAILAAWWRQFIYPFRMIAKDLHGTFGGMRQPIRVPAPPR